MHSQIKKIGLILIILGAFVIRLNFLGPTYFGDETLLMQLGKFVIQGYSPYLDFFTPHPPASVFSIAVFEFFFPDNTLLGGKLWAYFLSILITLVVFLLSKKLIGNTIASLGAAIIFTTTFSFYQWFSKAISSPLLTFFLLLALFAFLNRQEILTAFFLFMAASTELLALWLLLSFLIYAYLKEIQFKRVFGFFTIFSALELIFLVWFTKGAMIDQVFIAQTVARASYFDFYSNLSVAYGSFFSHFVGLILLISLFVLLSRDWLLPSLFFWLPSALLLFLSHLNKINLQHLVPFLAIFATIAAFKLTKDRNTRLLIFVILFLNAASEMSRLYAITQSGDNSMQEIAALIQKLTTETDEIGGAPEATLFALLANRPMSPAIVDSYPSTVAYLGEATYLQRLISRPPRLIIHTTNTDPSNRFESLRDFYENSYKEIATFEEPIVGKLTVLEKK